MKWFGLGCGITYAAMVVAAMLLTRKGVFHMLVVDWIRLAVSIALIPAIVCVATAGLIHINRPRRALLRAARCRVYAAMLGASSALLALSGAIAVITLYNRRVSDELVFGACAFLATLICVPLFTRRPRPGRCLRCRYDITHSTNYGRCPECGLSLAG